MFDSGVGGLSILAETRKLLPDESVVYLADQRWAPYGHRSLDEVKDRAIQVSGQLIEGGAKVVVVACNSASAAALHDLREEYPATPFVGLEPAVKPAALQSQTGVVGVLATKATFQGALFATVVDRHASDVVVETQVGNGLAEMVERGKAGTPEVKEMLTRYLAPLMDAGMDTLVLGCTHYPFLTSDIRSIVGDEVTIIDPAPAVAKQVARVVEDVGRAEDSDGAVRYATTADPERFAAMITALLGAAPDEPPTRW